MRLQGLYNWGRAAGGGLLVHHDDHVQQVICVHPGCMCSTKLHWHDIALQQQAVDIESQLWVPTACQQAGSSS